jgi:DNA-binding response OmpR family regulator
MDSLDSTKQSDPRDDLPEQRRSHVLVINDTKEILELFQELLEEEGFRVSLSSFTLNDIDEMVELAPDLVILDFLIGGEQQGWQMLQKMKMSRRTATIPVIVCTAARTLVQEIEGHLLSKNVGIVLKPFDIDELLSEVHLRLKPSIPQPTGPDTESPA